jgi:hypothetical protein
MSIGYLVEEDTAMIWRGPMVTQALEHAAAVNGCWQCHGSKVVVLEDGGLDPATWPNTGIGRIPRSGFSFTGNYTDEKN